MNAVAREIRNPKEIRSPKSEGAARDLKPPVLFRNGWKLLSDFGLGSAWLLAAVLGVGLLGGGCGSSTSAKLRERNAFLAGQNTVLMQQQAQNAAKTAAESPGVTVVGAVQHPQVPWITGLTLAQAIATANYVGADAPKQIVLTRNGESAAMDADVLLNGASVPLEIGDVIELR
jgi:hypothetical protein